MGCAITRKLVGHLREFSPSSTRMVYNRLTKWQKIIFILAENGSQKICICLKKAVPLLRN